MFVTKQFKIRSIHISLTMLVFITFVACSTTKEYVLTTLEPASVDLATNIKSIGIINESLVQEKKAYENRVEQILSEKDMQLDKAGKKAAITGLFDELLKDNRFDSIKIIDNFSKKDMGLGDSPSQIPWSKIESLCKANGVDAIFSLAHYDTETQFSLRKKRIWQANMLRIKEKVKGHEITLETLIENGWRIYNPTNKRIIDEIVFTEAFESTAQGTNAVQALIAIEDRSTAVVTQSKNKGESYGMRLLPSETGVIRKYFVRGTKELELAHMHAEQGDWKSAVALWESLSTHKKVKIQSRVAYNLAFYQELKGNLGGALHLAKRAQEKEATKTKLNYINVLKERIEENEIVKQQLARTYFQEES